MSRGELSKLIRNFEREIHSLEAESFSPIKSREDAESKRIRLFVLFYLYK